MNEKLFTISLNKTWPKVAAPSCLGLRTGNYELSANDLEHALMYCLPFCLCSVGIGWFARTVTYSMILTTKKVLSSWSSQAKVYLSASPLDWSWNNMKLEFHHINFVSEDVDRLHHFYTDTLGLTDIPMRIALSSIQGSK